MGNLKGAIRLLIDSGKIVRPDALDRLKRSNNPIKLVEYFIENCPDKQMISAVDLNIYDTRVDNNQIRSEVKSPDNLIPPKGKVPRRIYNNPIISNEMKINTTPANSLKSRQPKPIKKKVFIQNDKTIISTSFDDLDGLHNYQPEFKIMKEYVASNNFLGTIDDIIGYFQNRYNQLLKMFLRRSDIKGITKIKDIKRTHSKLSIIGMVIEKKFYSNRGGYIILDDPTSDKNVKIIITQSNKLLINECLQIMNDTVVCAICFQKNGTLIAEEIILPDIPNLLKSRRSSLPVHVAFLSDIHVGSKKFIQEPFDKFIDFLNGNYGSKKMKALGSQTKFVLFGGDVIDGVGVYPNQIDDLKITSIIDQYNTFTSFIERVPEDVQIFIIPGNHDMVRSAEPQPRIQPQYIPELQKMDNVHLTSNPSQLSIHDVQILLYHCTSLPDIMNSIPGMPINKPVEVMKHMLKARHLAPMWGSKTPIAAESQDYLVIDKIPDIFHGGHIHINGNGQYKGVQIVNSGTMQNQTSFQKSMNITPTPGQVSIVNLRDFSWNKINFMDK